MNSTELRKGKDFAKVCSISMQLIERLLNKVLEEERMHFPNDMTYNFCFFCVCPILFSPRQKVHLWHQM